MLTYHVIKTCIVNNIIAPHGITDVIHAVNKNQFMPLLFTYGTSICVSQIITPTILNSLYQLPLCISSFIHFHHDFELFFPNKYVSSIATIINLYYSIRYPEPYLYLYMCLLHVPNHYRMSWIYVKHHKRLLLVSIIICSIIMNNIKNHIKSSWYPSLIGTIIGHIAYGELFIHSNEYFSSFPKKILKII